ncbi:putative F-box protein [Camellia lanceoleosa]|uniref:F-box protein n=1 Tax=Camellia lanceoleosa TaxID=1840588 RepID=A0ACC0FX34_9ERIC|nr:putative F-box protein [Camellia lanceoleosa]
MFVIPSSSSIEEEKQEKIVGVGGGGIESLPVELLVEVLALVASSSFTDLFNSKLCVKSEFVLKWCIQSGNFEALYRQGMVEYFSHMRMESGLEHLKRAAEKGHVEASYVYGMILLSRGGQSTKQGLKLLNAMNNTCSNSKSLRIQECRERTKAIIHTMWINNHMVSQETNFCCHGKTRSTRVRETWRGRKEEDENTAVKLVNGIEVNLFCNMLLGRSV